MRRKYNLMLVVVVSMMAWGTTASGAPDSPVKNPLNNWRYYSPIQVEGSEKYKAMYLTKQVYSSALDNLADLRIIDNKGAAVPYYIVSGQNVTKQNELIHDSTLVATMLEKNDTLLDYKINPIRDNQDIMGNMLVFSLPNEKFLKHIVIYGSNDGNRWEQAGSDFVYRTERLQKNEVHLDQVNKYTYYRIRIIDNAEGISLPELQLIYNEKHSEWESYEKSTRLSYEMQNEGKETIIRLDNPQRLRIKEIIFDVNGNFQRSYVLYGSDQRAIDVEGVQDLYNLQFQENAITSTSISFAQSTASDQELTIKIANEDNPPLDINDITVVYYIDKMVFEDNGGAPYRLYYGNPQAQPPQYDLKQFQSYIEKEKQDLVKLANAVKVDEGETKPKNPFGINLKLLFNVIIVLISILLIFLLVRKMNRN